MFWATFIFLSFLYHIRSESFQKSNLQFRQILCRTKVTFSNTTSSSGHFDQISGPATANLLNTRQVQVQIAGPQSELLQGQQPLHYSFHSNREGLELVELKFNCGYRLITVNHGTFSYVDLRFGESPVALVIFPSSGSGSRPGSH